MKRALKIIVNWLFLLTVPFTWYFYFLTVVSQQLIQKEKRDSMWNFVTGKEWII